MRVVVRIALIVMLVLGLTGCYHIIAIPDVATAAVYGPNVPIRSLRPQEVARLSSWIKAHDAGWRDLMGMPSTPMTMRIVMREPNNQQSNLDLFESKDGTAMVHFYAPSPAPPLSRYLSEADVAALLSTVGN
ncbi:hypothetical protein GCM10007862_15530 [Dyella lipolytica]|nr:hypothetical protein GCM10007862_15530 [Dyella lipolytica]